MTRLIWCLTAIVAATPACAERQNAATGCRSDDQCGSGFACTGELCVPLVTPAGSWAIELLPRSDSTAAATEFNAITFAGGPVALTARSKVSVTGTLRPGSTLTSASHVLLTVAPEIPGRPDLQFEGEWPRSVDGAAPSAFVLTVPDSVLGKMATLQVMPNAPDDRKQAPVSLEVQLAPMLSLSLPTEALAVRGKLVSAIGDPEGGYVARLFQGTRLISNVFDTAADGSFNLAVPPSNIESDAPPIFVELLPRDDQTAKPRFRSQSLSLATNLDLGELRLPAFSQPNVFRFDVRGEAENGPPVGDAIVRARTVINDDPSGSAAFQRDGRTDASGVADLSLLPGSVNSLRTYDLSIIPATDSPYGVKCLTAFPLAGGGTAGAPALAKKIALPRKPILSGVVRRDDGVPAGGVTIVVTRLKSAPNAQCSDATSSPPASVTTAKDGTYRMPLDPGTYRIDYDPPVGAPVPRLTEMGIVITGDTERAVQMLPAAMIEGSVLGPDGSPLPSAGVRLLEVLCGGQIPCSGAGRVEPMSRGQTRTDANGNFRLVVPLRR